jgi:hypothetical protein
MASALGGLKSLHRVGPFKKCLAYEIHKCYSSANRGKEINEKLLSAQQGE